MTWGEFKKWVEDGGVKDDSEIHYIDFHISPWDDKPCVYDDGRFSIS